MARKPKLGKVEVKETVQNALESARGRTPVDVVVLSINADGTMAIDTSYNSILTSHILLNRAIFEINVLQMQSMMNKEEEKNV